MSYHHSNNDREDRYIALLRSNRIYKWISIVCVLLVTIAILNYCVLSRPYHIKQNKHGLPEITHETFNNDSPKTSAFQIYLPSNYCELTRPMTIHQMAKRWHVSEVEIRNANEWLDNIPSNKPIQPDKPIDVPPTSKPTPTPPESSTNMDQWEDEVLQLTNQQRENVGLKPLQKDSNLQKSAHEKSRDMAVHNYFDHNSPTYGTPFDMMKTFGVTYNSAGENIAQGQKSPNEVVQAWMNSSGHRANLLNAHFTHIGVGYVKGTGAKQDFWTQQFISK